MEATDFLKVYPEIDCFSEVADLWCSLEDWGVSSSLAVEGEGEEG